MLLKKGKYTKKNIYKKRKKLSLYIPQEPEEYNDLNILPLEYELEELSEINFNALEQLEIVNNLNSYQNKLEEKIYPDIRKDETNKEEKSFESNTDSPNLNLFLTKKRNRLNSSKNQTVNINNNIIIKKTSIFKIEKINKKKNFSENDFTQTKFKFFKTPKFHTFNPLFKKIKQKNIQSTKKIPNFQTLNVKKKICLLQQNSLF